jgi:hypothetical protein
MADGKVTLPYRQFLGYEKGEDGLPRIVEEEAQTVRLIYRLFVEGQTFSAIAKHLTNSGILSPAGKATWQTATVRSILTNEKYKGHALLQKTYCANFLTKKMVKNEGHIPQFYVEDSHQAIIDPHEFDAVQAEIERRKSLGTIGRCSDPFSGKLTCGDCGGLFGKKTWGSYSSDKTYRREIYRCNNKYENSGGTPCSTPFVTEAEIKARFLTAFNQLMANRDRLLTDCRTAKKAISDTSILDAEIAKLHQEVAVVAELHRKAIEENARTAQDQDEFNKQNDAYLERHREATERIDELEAARRDKIVKAKTLDRFISDIAKRPLVLTEFDAPLWLTTVDKVTIAAGAAMTFTFRNGTQIDV